MSTAISAKIGMADISTSFQYIIIDIMIIIFIKGDIFVKNSLRYDI